MRRPYWRHHRSLRSHGENRDPLDRFAGTLRVEIERAERLDVVSPPLEPRRCRHPEPIHVEDPTAHTELGHFGHGRDANVTHRLKSLDDGDRKSTRLNSSHGYISYAVFCLKKKK